MKSTARKTSRGRRSKPKPRRIIRSPRINRVAVIEVSFVLFWLALVVRLVYIEVLQRGKYQDLANVQHHTIIPLEARRGLILDRNENILALNEACSSVGIDLRRVSDHRAVAARLAPILGESAAQLRSRMAGNRPFVWLRRRVDVDLAQKIEALELPGIRIEKGAQRCYPHREIAAHVLGYTNVDNQGISGIELSYDSLLRGRPGRKVIQKDAIGNQFPDLANPEVPAVHGRDVILTIDYVLQTIATEELRRAVDMYDASHGVVLVTNPRTGEVLALVSEPGFDPHRPGAYSAATRRNRTITDVFEPGSTFKIVAMAAALQEKIKRPQDILFCENGSYRFAGQTITDHGEKYGWLTVADVLAKSSNIGMVKLARTVGAERLFRYARDFGFGMRTGIGLDGEVAGTLKPPVEWSGYTLAAMAMGYEVSVTAMQLAMAYGVIANGGLLLQPRIIAGVRESNGKLESVSGPAVVRRVISPQVAHQLSALLEQVVEKGTGVNAAIDGVAIAGKTGTAQKALRNARGYSKRDFIASFVGFFPVEQPRYLILVLLDTPRKIHWGGLVAAPTFRRIAQRILTSEPKPAVTQQEGETVPNSANLSETIMDDHKITLPDLTSRQRSVGEEILHDLGLEPVWDGEGDFILNQLPPPGSIVLRDSKVTLQLFEIAHTQDQIEMPNLIGLSVRQALQRLATIGIDARVRGSGRVVEQFPPAGTPVSTGIRCDLRCRADSFVTKQAAAYY